MSERRLRAAALAAGLAVAVLIPFFFSSFRVSQFSLVLAYAVAVLGLNLLVGYNGQISLGHGAFFAVGAYTAALLIGKASFPYIATVPLAGLVAFAAGFLFGVPALRLRGPYLALVTLGLAIATPQLIKRFDGLTEGTQGLTVNQPTPPGWLPLANDQFIYFVTLAVAAVMFVLAWNLVRGQAGRAIVAVRDNEIPAKAMGIDIARIKTRTFAVSAAFAGVAGALYVFSIGFVAPESFTVTLSLGLLAAMVVGGVRSVGGAIFGALFIEFVPVWAGDVNQALTGVVYGVVLIAFMFVLPGGMASLGKRVKRIRKQPSAPPKARTETTERRTAREGLT
jgi:branched-chain amino acid transport system permease protein